MPLKTPAEYVESLRDGRVIFWDGDKIEDVTEDPRFRVPIAVAARDYEYDDPKRRELTTLRDRGRHARAPRVPDPAHRGRPAASASSWPRR